MTQDQQLSHALGYKKALKMISMQIEASISKTKGKSPTKNTPQQSYNDGYLKALQHTKDKVDGKIKNL